MSTERIQFSDSEGNVAGAPKAAKGYYTENAQGQRGGGFLSREALTKAMSSPLYGVDQDYTRAVQQAVGQTGGEVTFGGPDRQAQQNEHRAVQACEVTLDNTVALFSNPLYQTSAAYRAEVEAILRGTRNDWVQQRPLGDQSGCTRVVMANDATVPSMKPRAEQFYDEE